MSQWAGTDLKTGLQGRTPVARIALSQRGLENLEQALLDEPPAPATQAEADVANVRISTAATMLLRGIYKPRVSRGAKLSPRPLRRAVILGVEHNGPAQTLAVAFGAKVVFFAKSQVQNAAFTR